MLQDLVMKNRSYRGFDESVAISEETLREFVALARITPSSTNLQPIKYLLSWTRETNDKIFPYTRWAGKLSHLKLPREGHHPTAYIVLCIDTKLAPNTLPFYRDIGIVAQTMLLAAAEKGLGGIMIGSFDKEAIRREFALADHLEPNLVIALGQPDEFIMLENAKNGDVSYYRDEYDNHHVPKRPLDELIIG